MVRVWVRVGAIAAGLAAACQHHEPPPPPDKPPALAPPPSGAIGIAACDDYLRRVRACVKLPDAARAALLAGTGAWATAAHEPGATATTAEKVCRETAQVAAAQLAELGC